MPTPPAAATIAPRRLLTTILFLLLLLGFFCSSVPTTTFLQHATAQGVPSTSTPSPSPLSLSVERRRRAEAELMPIAADFHIQDLLFGPTDEEIDRYCVSTLSEVYVRRGTISNSSTSSTNSQQQNTTIAAGVDALINSAIAAVLSDALQTAAREWCRAETSRLVYLGLAGMGNVAGGGSSSSTTATPPPPPHGTLVFRVLPPLFYKGVVADGNDDDPLVVLGSTPTDHTNAGEMLLSGATSDTSPTTGGYGGWFAFNRNIVAPATATSQEVTPTSNKRGGGGASSTRARGLRQQADTPTTTTATLKAFEAAYSPTPIPMDPSRTLLGASLAVLCDASGFAANTTTATSSITSSSMIIHMTNLSLVCGMGDYRRTTPVTPLTTPTGDGGGHTLTATTSTSSSSTFIVTRLDLAALVLNATANVTNTWMNSTTTKLVAVEALANALGDITAVAAILSDVIREVIGDEDSALLARQYTDALFGRGRTSTTSSSPSSSAIVGAQSLLTRLYNNTMLNYIVPHFYQGRLRGNVFVLSWDRDTIAEAFGDVADAVGAVGKTVLTRKAAAAAAAAASSGGDASSATTIDTSFCGGVDTTSTIAGTPTTSWMTTETVERRRSRIEASIETVPSAYPKREGSDGVVDTAADPAPASILTSALGSLPSTSTEHFDLNFRSHTLSNTYSEEDGVGSGLVGAIGGGNGNTFIGGIITNGDYEGRRVAIRVPTIVPPSVGTIASSSSSSGTIPPRSADIIIADTVVACEPLRKGFRYTGDGTNDGGRGILSRSYSSLVTNGSAIERLRPFLAHRPSERTAAGTSFAFASTSVVDGCDVDTQPTTESTPSTNGDFSGGSNGRKMGSGRLGAGAAKQARAFSSADVNDRTLPITTNWDASLTSSTPQSIFAFSYAMPRPYGFAEMSPAPRGVVAGGHMSNGNSTDLAMEGVVLSPNTTTSAPSGSSSSSTAAGGILSSAKRSAAQRGARIVVECTDVDGGLIPNRTTSSSLALPHVPVVGIVGLSPTPQCQSSGAVVAYAVQQGIVVVSRNMSTMARYLGSNLRIFNAAPLATSVASSTSSPSTSSLVSATTSSRPAYGFRLDLSSNFGAPMASHTNPLSPTNLPDGSNRGNIAWFDVMEGSLASAGSVNNNPNWVVDDADTTSDDNSGGADDGSSSSSSSGPSTAGSASGIGMATFAAPLTSTRYLYPTFPAAAIATCASGRRVISEQNQLPKGEPLNAAVTVIVAAPHFGPLILSRALVLGMRAWTNLSCYIPSGTNADDVAAMGGIEAFRYAEGIEEWSSHPLSGVGVDSLSLVMCYTRQRINGVRNSNDQLRGAAGYVVDGIESDNSAGAREYARTVSGLGNIAGGTSSSSSAAGGTDATLAAYSYFPTFTIHPDGFSGEGTYPTSPSYTFSSDGGTAGSTRFSSAFQTSQEKRSLRIRLSKMARPHRSLGYVVPMYVTSSSYPLGGNSGEADGNFVVLGSAALTDFLIISDSNAGRIGFVPTVADASNTAGGSGLNTMMALTPRFTFYTSPEEAERVANDPSYRPATSTVNPSVIANNPSGGAGAAFPQPYKSYADPLADGASSDTERKISSSTTVPHGGYQNVFLAHRDSAYADDISEAECAAPVSCVSTDIYTRSLNLCSNPACGSWINSYNSDTYECNLNGAMLAGMILAVVVGGVFEVVLQFLYQRLYTVLDKQESAAATKKLV